MNGLERAIGIAGGVTALASAVGAAASAPSMWRSRGKVPAEWCPSIERATGVPCEEIRPDVPWEVLRKPLPDAPSRERVTCPAAAAALEAQAVPEGV